MSRDDGRPFDIVAFDVDGTLVRHPEGWTVWEVLNARFTGAPEVNKQRYAAYLRGELSYAEWVALDIGSWREAGARREDIRAAFAPLTLVDGTLEALRTLEASGVRLFVISGTLDLLLDTLLPEHPFEEVYANAIAFDDEGRIAGWRATPFDMDGKAMALRAIAMREGVPLSRCAFVGDSGNDAWIAKVAGMTVAFNPKTPEFEKLAAAVVRSDDLRDVLPPLLGE